MANSTEGKRILARTSGEIKRYRTYKRVIPILIGCTVLLLVFMFIAAALYRNTGSFVVSTSAMDTKYGLSLSETPDFYKAVSRLDANISQEITNISGSTLPANLDNINGAHNGINYVAFTFYCKNVGSEKYTYEYQLYIQRMSLGIEEAVRIRLYVNGEETTFAKTRKDGEGAETGTTEFLTEKTITAEQVLDFKPGDVTKYTVVIWLEGDDPDCVDNIIGGQIGVTMSMRVIGVE